VKRGRKKSDLRGDPASCSGGGKTGLIEDQERTALASIRTQSRHNGERDYLLAGPLQEGNYFEALFLEKEGEKSTKRGWF